MDFKKQLTSFLHKLKLHIFVNKILLCLSLALMLFSCDFLQDEKNYYTQTEVQEGVAKDIITFHEGEYFLNSKYLMPYFTENPLKTIEIYEINTEVFVRNIEITNNITRRVQLHPGVVGIRASDGYNEIGFVSKIGSGNVPLIIIDEFSLLSVELLHDIILEIRDTSLFDQVREIDTQKLYYQIQTLQSFENIFYEEYVTYIIENGLPDNLLPFFVLQLSAPSFSNSLELDWNENNDDAFLAYEIYRSRSPDLKDSILIDTITESEHCWYRGDIRINDIFYYFIRIRNTDFFRSTNAVVLAKYPSGVIIQLRQNEVLTSEYDKYQYDYRSQLNYFICLNIDEINEDGIPPDTSISFYFTINDFIANERDSIYSWDTDDPTYGYLILSPRAVEFINNIYMNFRTRFQRGFRIKYAYISPFKAEKTFTSDEDYEDNIQHIFGDTFKIEVETEEQWVAIARLADSLSVSYIKPRYVSHRGFFNETDDSHWIHLDWRCYPSYVNQNFIYNPPQFHNHYSLEYVVVNEDEAEKCIEIRKNGVLVESADFNKYHVKVCPESPAGYFCIEEHHKDTETTEYRSFDTFHQYECSKCKGFIKEEHTWLLTDEEESLAEEDRNLLFDDDAHWKNECIYCSYRKGEEAHQVDEEAGWVSDLTFHGRKCTKCKKMLNQNYHIFGEWEPLENTRLHYRTCIICKQAQVRPHSRVTNWIPAIGNEDLGHAKYCSECWVKVEPMGDAKYLPHEPEEEYSYNDRLHWHYCKQCRHLCDVAFHSFTPWINAGGGFHERSCTVCGANFKDAHNYGDWVPFPEDNSAGHVKICKDCQFVFAESGEYDLHVPSDTWEHNRFYHWQPCVDCGYACNRGRHTGTGSWKKKDEFDHWRVCQVCGVEFGEEPHDCDDDDWVPDTIINMCKAWCPTCDSWIHREHTFGEWYSPDAQSDYHVRVCSRCNQKEFENHIPLIIWESDGDFHWHPCSVCGHKCDITAHIPSATWENDEDFHWHPCSVCGYKCNMTAHVPSVTWEYDEDSHWHICTVCGGRCEESSHVPSETWDSDAFYHWHRCDICNASLGPEYHDFSLIWVFDDDIHWQACTVCGRRRLQAVHDISTTWESDDNTHWHPCNVCDFRSNEADHILSGVWDYDSVSHWHACNICGHKCDVGTHTMTEWQDIGDGKEERTCEICDYREER